LVPEIIFLIATTLLKNPAVYARLNYAYVFVEDVYVVLKENKI